jgi:hypothetical protein
MKIESYKRLIEYIRWPIRTRCVFCYSIITEESVSLHKNGWKVYYCPECKNNFTVLSNSTFERTKLNPKQLWTLLYLIRHDKLIPSKQKDIFDIRKHFKGVPSAIARKVGVHHWTMTKIMNRVKGKSPKELLNKFWISGIEEAFTESLKGSDKELLPVILLLFTYKFITMDPRGLRTISGCTSEFVQKAVERIKETWEPGKEFEEDEHNWYDPNFDVHNEMVLMLHCMCVTGELKRDPATKMWSVRNTENITTK